MANNDKEKINVNISHVLRNISRLLLAEFIILNTGGGGGHPTAPTTTSRLLDCVGGKRENPVSFAPSRSEAVNRRNTILQKSSQLPSQQKKSGEYGSSLPGNLDCSREILSKHTLTYTHYVRKIIIKKLKLKLNQNKEREWRI